MKKLFFISMMLMTMAVAQAQLKVAPKMQKGDVKNYATTSVIEIPGQSPLTIRQVSSISVTAAAANGYTLAMTVKEVTSDAGAGNIAGQLISASQELMKGFTLQLATDADGKVQKIVNYAEIQQLLNKRCEEFIEQMVKTVPQLAQMKDAMKQQIVEGTSEASLVRTIQEVTSPLSLNGKTLMTGAQEEYVNEQGMKMKRMYFVNGNNVTTNSSLNMTKDEMKAYIIQKVEQTLPEQADMVKQNIDQLMESGMMKMEMTETATFELQADGWVKSIKAENTSNAMGQQTKSTTTVTLQ